MQNNIEDIVILEQFKKTGDTKTIGVLYKKYAHLVFGLAMKYLKNEDQAKDAVMDIFEKILNKVNNQEITNFKSWLYMISKNHIMDIFRKQKKHKTEDFENNFEIFMENDDNLRLTIENNEKLLANAISNLKAEQKQCIELFYLQEKNYTEVASITGLDFNKVKSAIQNGKRNLKIFMEENKYLYNE